MSGNIEDLSEGMKDCLRLYYQRYEAKEIARQLGISPATVHQRLTAARKILGVSKSMEAARQLAQAEQGSLYDRVLYNGIDVADPAEVGPKWFSRLMWPLPTRRRPTHDLSLTQLLITIVALAAFLMVAMALYLIAIHLVSDGLRSAIQA